ncbi:hypothetical protein QTN25_007393 [Entamoeba marina]
MKRILDIPNTFGTTSSPPTLTKVLQLITAEFIPSDAPSLNDALLMIEEAWWYYIDVYRLLYPELPRMDLNDFVKTITSSVQSLNYVKEMLKTTNIEQAVNDFKIFKTNIPCYGAIILDTKLEYILLVKGFRTNKWGLPKGKMKVEEDPVECAIREVEEEIGFNIRSHLVNDSVELNVANKKITYYFCPYVPLDIRLQPNTRMEIHKITWHSIKNVMKEVENKKPEYGFINSKLIRNIQLFINKITNSSKQTSTDDSFNFIGTEYFTTLYKDSFRLENLHR